MGGCGPRFDKHEGTKGTKRKESGNRYFMSSLCELRVFVFFFLLAAPLPAQQLDPAAWGIDHVGKPVPAFVSGDECLFCHRDVGPTWGANRHGQTIRTADPFTAGLAALLKSPQTKNAGGEVELLLGAGNRLRFLK